MLAVKAWWRSFCFFRRGREVATLSLLAPENPRMQRNGSVRHFAEHNAGTLQVAFFAMAKVKGVRFAVLLLTNLCSHRLPLADSCFLPEPPEGAEAHGAHGRGTVPGELHSG
jgi:hypothetical protein